jgi:hypothetical protein
MVKIELEMLDLMMLVAFLKCSKLLVCASV